jgi:glycosyltransferase involved in cell wall biosynthesis
MEYSIILPAYNEAKTVARAIHETAAVFDPISKQYEIIVVDDGSTDDTAKIVALLAAELPMLKLVQHAQNLGKGTAVRTGMLNAQGEFVLFLDSDLSTHPREAPAFIDKMKECDIVIGSRRVPGAVIAKPQPWHRSLSGRAINFAIRHLLKLPHRDTQCGFKMFRLASAQNIFQDLGPSRWTFDAEVLLRAYAAGLRVGELPVTWLNNENSRVRVGAVVHDLYHLIKLKNKFNK